MEKRFALFISRVFNPLLITTFFLIISLNLHVYFASMIPQHAKWMILGLAIISTAIIPALMISVFSALINKNNKLTFRESRILSLTVTAVFYLLTYHLFNQISLSPIFSLFVLGFCTLSVLSLLVVIFSNLSLYMVAAGGLTGAFLGIHLTLDVNLIFYIILTVLLGGIVGFARLYLGQHKPAEVYLGYLAGMVIMFLHYLYL